MKIRFTRLRAAQQKFVAQLDALRELVVDMKRIYGSNVRAGKMCAPTELDGAFIGVRAGGQSVAARLDRIRCSNCDARESTDELGDKNSTLRLESVILDSTDSVDKFSLSFLTIIAEWWAGLINMQKLEGVAVTRIKERLSSTRLNLSPIQDKPPVDSWRTSELTSVEFALASNIARSTMNRGLDRVGVKTCQ